MNFLAQLMHEGMSHLQQHLTASVLGRKVFCMPFHRGAQVSGETLGAMKAALAYCQKVRAGCCSWSKSAACSPYSGAWCCAVRVQPNKLVSPARRMQTNMC